MAASTAPSDFNTNDPNAVPGPSARHGSAEQGRDRFGRPTDNNENADSYLNSMTPPAASPRTRSTAPRTSRNRSPRREGEEEDDDDFDARRDQRREAQRRRAASNPAPPVGEDFRLRACEQSLREHQVELAAQRVTLQQMKAVFEENAKDKIITGNRLDAVFDLVDNRFTEYSEFSRNINERTENLNNRLTVLTDLISGLTTSVSERMNNLETELMKFITTAQQPPTSQDETSPTPRASRSGPTGSGPMPQTPVPPTPRSWSAPESPLTHNTGASQGIGARAAQQTPVPNAPTWTGDTHNGSVPTFGINSPPAPPNARGSQHFPTSVRHVTGTNTAYFNVGTPGNHWSPHRPPAANFGGWAPGAGTQNKPFDVKEWSVEGKKVTKELRSFDGDMAAYDNWRRRIRDHFVSVNCNYALVFDLIEQQKTPIDWNLLATTRVAELPYLNWSWVATHMWSFTGAYLTDNQLTNRSTLVGGQEFNGLEHWRALYLQNCGGSSEMANAERGFWIDFPKCERSTDLHAHLTQWIALKQKYGNHLPEDHLIHMLHGILPDEVREAVRQQRDMRFDLQRQLNFIFSEISQFVDSKLSKWNLAKLQQSLKPKVKNTTGINLVQASDAENSSHVDPPPPVPDMASFNANVKRMINAAVARGRESGRDSRRTPPASRSGSAGSQRGRSTTARLPNPRFKGCWCCGSEDHSRKDCPVFSDIKKKNGGKVPKDYVGAYEKSMKRSSTAVKAIRVESFPDECEHAETFPVWPVLSLPGIPVKTSNKFDVFADRDESEDEESEIVKALSQISAKVTKGHTSQREKKSHQRSSLGVAKLNALAQQINDGVINLPDIQLENDDDFEYVWALVDSGAGANVARKNQFPNSVPVDAPPIALTVANGETLPNRGARKVVCTNPDGTQRTRIFYEADVDMPILSVAEISQEGSQGSEVSFRKRNGFIEDVQSGQRMHFIKRKGVYFIRLRVPKNGKVTQKHETGFTRPVR